MDLLNREHASVLPEAWEAVDEEAKGVLTANLAGRKLVDVDGPHGWNLAAVNLGRLDLFKEQPIPKVHVGRRRVLPLIEFRIPIQLEIMELDSIARGAKDPDLGPVQEAAEKAALTEDRAIFQGYKEGGIVGIMEASPHAPLPLPQKGPDLIAALVEAKETLRSAGVGGPYVLAAGTSAYNQLQTETLPGYPLPRRVADILGNPPVHAPAIEGALLVSVRGGDFILTVGQDLAIGFAHQEKYTVELYLTESFTFRVVEPAAAIYLKP